MASRLEANAPRVLRGGEEVQIGDVRLIYHPLVDEDATAPGEADTTQRVILSKPTYQIELEGPDMAVAPGHTHRPCSKSKIWETRHRQLSLSKLTGCRKGGCGSITSKSNWNRANRVRF